MQPVIFFDMDGVLCRWVCGALALHKSHLTHEQVVEWGIEALMGIDPGVFWNALDYEFAADLGVYADGLALLRRAEALVGPENIGLLSSPWDTPGCRDGKVEWVRRNLPEYRRRLFLGADKHLIAAPSKILVDDYDGHVRPFQSAGGHVVKPPRPWNSRRNECLPGGFFDAVKEAEILDHYVSRVRSTT